MNRHHDFKKKCFKFQTLLACTKAWKHTETDQCDRRKKHTLIFNNMFIEHQQPETCNMLSKYWNGKRKLPAHSRSPSVWSFGYLFLSLFQMLQCVFNCFNPLTSTNGSKNNNIICLLGSVDLTPHLRRKLLNNLYSSDLEPKNLRSCTPKELLKKKQKKHTKGLYRRPGFFLRRHHLRRAARSAAIGALQLLPQAAQHRRRRALIMGLAEDLET